MFQEGFRRVSGAFENIAGGFRGTQGDSDDIMGVADSKEFKGTFQVVSESFQKV